MEPWVFGLSAGVTAALAGVTVWSGIDMLSLNNVYVDYSRGAGATFDEVKCCYGVANDAQLRTNILIGVSAAAAVATIAMAFFTDFDGEPSVTPTVSADATGATFGLLHHFE